MNVNDTWNKPGTLTRSSPASGQRARASLRAALRGRGGTPNSTSNFMNWEAVPDMLAR